MQLTLYFFYQHYLSTVHGKKIMMRCDNIGIWLSVIEKLTRNTNNVCFSLKKLICLFFASISEMCDTFSFYYTCRLLSIFNATENWTYKHVLIFLMVNDNGNTTIFDKVNIVKVMIISSYLRIF